MVALNQRVQSNAYANRDNLKNKEWSAGFWDWELNDDMIKYFQSDIYKRDASHYFTEKMNFIEKVIKFKIDAIDAYKKIIKLNDSNTVIPKHVNYSFGDPEILSQFAGDFQIEHNDFFWWPDLDLKFVMVENQLKEHLTAFGEDYKSPLFWHTDYIFFNYETAAIYEFGITDEGNITCTLRLNGSKSQFIKK